MHYHVYLMYLLWLITIITAKKQYNYHEHYHDVIILGAGVAGISVASILDKSDDIDDFIIIEAQNYIGGRIKTIQFAGYNLNIGASSIRNYKTNPMVSLATKYNISTSLTYPKDSKQFEKHSIYLNSNGDIVEFNSIIKPTLMKWQKANKCAHNIISHARLLAVDKFNYLYYDEGHFWAHILLFIPLIIIFGFSCLVLNFLCSNRPCFCCIIWTQIFILFYISACIFYQLYNYHNVLFEDQPYSFLLQQCGWNTVSQLTPAQKIIQYLYFELEYGASADNVSMHSTDIKRANNYYGTQQLFINDNKGYQGIILKMSEPFQDKIILNQMVNRIEILNPKHKKQTIKIFTNKQNVFQCKYLIISFSIGVLQNKAIKFYPRLPAFKRKSITNYEMVDYTIIYIKWDYNFWNKKFGGKEKKYILFMDESDEISYYKYALNLNHKDFYSGSLIWRFDLTANKETIHVEYQNKNITVQTICNQLQRYFDGVPCPDPLHVFVSHWKRNHFTRGAFTNWPVGFTANDIGKIKRVWYKNVYFIGSDLSIHSQGYVDGGFYQGQQIGNTLVKRIKNSKHKNK